MNPLKLLQELQQSVSKVNDRLNKLEQAQAGSAAKKQKVSRARSYPRPLTPEAKAVFLLVWECLSESEKPITIQALCKLVHEQDTQNLVPAGLDSHGDVVRALIAEAAGVKVMWAQQPLLHAHECKATQHLPQMRRVLKQHKLLQEDV